MTLNDFERQTVPPHLHALAARARAALGRFTTYPGTALRIEFGGGQSAFVAASIETEDADGTGRQVCVQKAARLNLAELGGDIDAQLGALAREALIQLFTHEVDEWLRIDGARCRQPHPDPIRGLALHPCRYSTAVSVCAPALPHPSIPSLLTFASPSPFARADWMAA